MAWQMTAKIAKQDGDPVSMTAFTPRWISADGLMMLRPWTLSRCGGDGGIVQMMRTKTLSVLSVDGIRQNRGSISKIGLSSALAAAHGWTERGTAMRLIDADILYMEMQDAEELARRRVRDTESTLPYPTNLNPAYTRYLAQMDERTKAKEMVADAPTVDAVPVGDVFALAIALNKEIEVLGLSVRAYHALSRWGCRTVGDVYRLLKSGEIKKVRNLGDKSIGEIEDGLYEYLPYLWQTEGR